MNLFAPKQWQTTPTALLNCALALCATLVCGCNDGPPTAKGKSATQKEAADTWEVTTDPSEGDPISDDHVPTDPAVENPAVGSPNAQASALSRSRVPDDRPSINDARLKAIGIARFESRRLRILTDLPAAEVAHLPQLADQLFESLEAHFGPLSDASDGSEFQVTGHLIGDEQKFRAAGLMPSETLTFKHGRHWNYQFWIFQQKDDYYQRHLLFHEFVHCFMTSESGMQNIPPLWYIEGMAEYFATHRMVRKTDGTEHVRFGVLPRQAEGFEGWGRIAELKRSFLRPQADPESLGTVRLAVPNVASVTPDTVASFDTDIQYASSWAVCWLIQNHDEYSRVFAPLRTARTQREFADAFRASEQTVSSRLAADWLLFVESLTESFDTSRSFPVHADRTFTVQDLNAGEQTLTLPADGDWLDTGLRLQTGESATFTCSGRFQVNDDPEPWISEPQGISIEYFKQRPIGQVVGTFVGSDGAFVTQRFSIGTESTVRANVDCAVWIQINDSSADRRNNRDTAHVTITK